MSCQLQAGNQAGPQSSILTAGPGMLGGALSQSWGAPGVQAGLCEPQPCAYPQVHTHGTYCVPEQSWCWRLSKTGGSSHRQDVGSATCQGELLPLHLESTASHPREEGLRGEGPTGCRGPRVQHVDAGAPHLRRQTSVDPGRGWQGPLQKVAERMGNRFFAGTLPKFRESAPRRPVSPR